jgi:phage-related protein
MYTRMNTLKFLIDECLRLDLVEAARHRLHCKKGIIQGMAWLVEFLNEGVKEAFDEFPLDIRARFQRIVELIQSHGLERVREPYVKHLEGPLWEMRMKGKSGIARAIYVTAVNKRIVIVHVFEKKTQKTPPREIITALKRAKEIQ